MTTFWILYPRTTIKPLFAKAVRRAEDYMSSSEEYVLQRKALSQKANNRLFLLTPQIYLPLETLTPKLSKSFGDMWYYFRQTSRHQSASEETEKNKNH